MIDKLSKALDTCLLRIGRGDSIEQCLSAYPELESELGQLLHIFTLISGRPKEVPSQDFRLRSKARLMAHIRPSDTRERKRSQQVAGGKRSVWQTIFSPRKLALPVIGIVVLVVASMLFSNMFGLWSPAPVLAKPCILSTLSGSVKLQEPDSDVWVSGTDGMILDCGSRIKTASNSHALLTFFDGSTIELEPEANIEIKEIKYRKQQDTRIIVKQLNGITWSHVSSSFKGETHFRIETPSAEVTVLGTLFAVEVDESGSTKVAAIEGSVTVSAQKQEIRLTANQQTSVDAGAAPALPITRGEALSKLIITIKLPGVASVRDPSGASTGCFPDGISFNQIKDSFLELLPDGSQLITIPQPGNGRYILAIRNTREQSVLLGIKAVSLGEVVFAHQERIGGTGDVGKIMHLNIIVRSGKIVSVDIVDVEPLINQVPEEVIVTELAVERAVPIKTAIEEAGKQPVERSMEETQSGPDNSSENGTADKPDSMSTGEMTTKEDSPNSARDEEIIRTDKPVIEDNYQDKALDEEGAEEAEAGVTGDTDNSTLFDRSINLHDDDLTKEKSGGGQAGVEADVTDDTDNSTSPDPNIRDDKLINEKP
jgi:hypothetical protein